MEFNGFPHLFSKVCFLIPDTEQPLKAFLCTRMRAESIDRQPIFYHKTMKRMESNDFPHIFPTAVFAIEQSAKTFACTRVRTENIEQQRIFIRKRLKE